MKTLLAVATVALAAATFAAGPKAGPKNGRPGGNEGPTDPVVRFVTNPKMAEKIGLTPEQQKQIKQINATSRESTEGLRQSLHESMKRQTELLKAEKIDEAAVMAEIDKAFDARRELAKRQTKRIIAIKSILTPEQVQKALEEIKNKPVRERERQESKRKDPADKGPGGNDKPSPPAD